MLIQHLIIRVGNYEATITCYRKMKETYHKYVHLKYLTSATLFTNRFNAEVLNKFYIQTMNTFIMKADNLINKKNYRQVKVGETL